MMGSESHVAYAIRWSLLLGIAHGFGQVSAQESPTSSILEALENVGCLSGGPPCTPLTTLCGHWAYGYAGVVGPMLRRTRHLGQRNLEGHVQVIACLGEG